MSAPGTTPRPELASSLPLADAPLSVLDLFSGIGGFSLGLERTGGFETVAFCEISAKCRHLLKHHWPEVPAYDDICTLTGERLAADGIAVDAICGGFPCQDLSFAGAGAGLSGARSGLFWQIARLVRELIDAGRRPAFIILENVSALLSRGLGDVLGALAALGYDVWWDCIPASAVGAPHRRDRIWIVAYARGEQHQGFGDAFRRTFAAELLGSDYLADAAERERDVVPPAQPLQHQGPRALAPRGRDGASHVPNAASDGWDQGRAHGGRRSPGGGAEQGARPWGSRGWQSEPDVGRVAHGVPARVDRLHGLGNAVVPEIPYRLGRAILAADAAQRAGATPSVSPALGCNKTPNQSPQ